MPKAKNKVIEGYGKNSDLRSDFSSTYVYFNPPLASQTVKLNKEYIQNYDLITEDKAKVHQVLF